MRGRDGIWAPAPAPGGKPQLIVREAEPPNLEMPVAYQVGWITPEPLFYQRNHFQTPPETDQRWEVEVAGRVERPLRLGLPELRRWPVTSQVATLECSGNKRAFFEPEAEGTPWREGAVGTAEWTGIPLRLVLERAGVQPGAVEVRFTGADAGLFKETRKRVHFERSLPLEKALDPRTLLAYEMNGRPLPHRLGGPLRLIVPGWYGMASVKWLTRMEVRSRPFRGPFQVRDYVYLPAPGAYGRAVPVTVGKVNSVITYPEDGTEVRPGRLVVRGLAWSGAAPVVRVQTSMDRGQTWTDAELVGPEAPFAWQQWHAQHILDRLGAALLLARATDAAGHAQPPEAPWNAKGYGNNRWAQVALTITRRPGLMARRAERRAAPSPPRSAPRR